MPDDDSPEAVAQRLEEKAQIYRDRGEDDDALSAELAPEAARRSSASEEAIKIEIEFLKGEGMISLPDPDPDPDGDDDPDLDFTDTDPPTNPDPDLHKMMALTIRSLSMTSLNYKDLCRAIAAIGTLMFVAHLSLAEDANMTQVGTVEAALHEGPTETGDPVFRFFCPDITFPKEFGDPPNVIVSFDTAFPLGDKPNQRYGYKPGLVVKATKITTKGFKPLISGVVDAAVGGVTYARKPTKEEERGIVRRVLLNWTAVGPTLSKGTVHAKYVVLTVVYAPPGTSPSGGHSASSVSYAEGSTTGVTTSGIKSFQTSSSLSAEAEGGLFGTGGGAGLSFTFSKSTTDSQSLEIRKSKTYEIQRPGPAQDGINHDEDAIYLLLNPAIDFAFSPSSTQWMLRSTESSSPIVVFVGYLNGKMQIPDGVAAALKSAGISEADYPEILARDPLVANPSAVDSPRYQYLNTKFSYQPPANQGDPVLTWKLTINDSTTATTGTSVEDSYKVGLTHFDKGNYLGFVSAKLTEAQSWTWTNKSSQSNASTSSQSAQLVVGGPAFGYPGPTELRIYLDRIYHTFAFALVPPSTNVGVNGVLVDPAGKPIPEAEVTLRDRGSRYRTFTNAKGEYTFPDVDGSKEIEAAGVVRQIPANSIGKPLTIQSK